MLWGRAPALVSPWPAAPAAGSRFGWRLPPSTPLSSGLRTNASESVRGLLSGIPCGTKQAVLHMEDHSVVGSPHRPGRAAPKELAPSGSSSPSSSLENSSRSFLLSRTSTVTRTVPGPPPPAVPNSAPGTCASRTSTFVVLKDSPSHSNTTAQNRHQRRKDFCVLGFVGVGLRVVIRALELADDAVEHGARLGQPAKDKRRRV